MRPRWCRLRAERPEQIGQPEFEECEGVKDGVSCDSRPKFQLLLRRDFDLLRSPP